MSKGKRFACPCCGCLTLDYRREYDICPVCYWEDDAYIFIKDGKIESLCLDRDVDDEKLLDVPSSANHGLTLREGRENYQKFGACEESMIEYVRKPKKRELPNSGDRRKSERSS